MRKTLGLLLVTTIITPAIGIPGWSAVQSCTRDVTQRGGWEMSTPAPIMLAESDEDEHDDDEEDSAVRRREHGDDHEDDECDDEEDSCKAANDAAPAGTTAPPQNGLFGTGATPKVKVN